jgi:hypothetical protein
LCWTAEKGNDRDGPHSLGHPTWTLDCRRVSQRSFRRLVSNTPFLKGCLNSFYARRFKHSHLHYLAILTAHPSWTRPLKLPASTLSPRRKIINASPMSKTFPARIQLNPSQTPTILMALHSTRRMICLTFPTTVTILLVL